jgi:hypothetical protein
MLANNQGNDHAAEGKKESNDGTTVSVRIKTTTFGNCSSEKYFATTTYYNAKASEKISMISIPTKSLF